MWNPAIVMTTLLSAEFVFYAISLCSPHWLLEAGGVNVGLFTLCSDYRGLSTCTLFPAWMGNYSLSWICLSASGLLSLLSLLLLRPALNGGRKAGTVAIINIGSVVFCAGGLIAFLVSVSQLEPDLLHRLDWTFYFCCATFFYALLVSGLLGFVRGSRSRVEPDTGQGLRIWL